MMKRSLAGRARDVLVHLMLVGSAYACGKDIVKPSVDTIRPTQTIAEVSPTSGVSLVNVTARYECKDDNGIKEYRIINGDQTIASSNSIDAIIHFTASGSVKL